jgi:ribosomal protein L16 Arg81 hydroxylase
MERSTLADLIAPMTVNQFIDDHWHPEAPLVARASDLLLTRLRAIPGLGSVSDLLALHQREVMLFGPNASRSMVSPKSALDFLPMGFNVYVTHVEQTIPLAHAWVSSIARELGVPPWDVYLEAFAGTQNAVSSRHYDYDVNFQILLEGEKIWRVEPNDYIRNPQASYHITRDANGQMARFAEELDARGPHVPVAFDPETTREHRTSAGSVLFLPRAYWHEVTSLSRTWGINIVLRGSTYASCLVEALSTRLHRQANFRAFLGVSPTRERVEKKQAEAFAAIKRAAIAEIEAIGVDEASLAGINQAFEFTQAASTRRIIDGAPPVMEIPGLLDTPFSLDEDAAEALRVVFTFKHAFTWRHALAATRYSSPYMLFNLLQRLVNMQILARVV